MRHKRHVDENVTYNRYVIAFQIITAEVEFGRLVECGWCPSKVDVNQCPVDVGLCRFCKHKAGKLATSKLIPAE